MIFQPCPGVLDNLSAAAAATAASSATASSADAQGLIIAGIGVFHVGR